MDQREDQDNQTVRQLEGQQGKTPASQKSIM
jgi:hypothetical protein